MSHSSSQPSSNKNYRELMTKALLELKKTKSKLRALEQAQQEPIAIIGMATRFPGGANTPALFWELLSNGRDAMIEVPPERWDIDAFYDSDPYAIGKMYTRSGGFLPEVALFDSEFFGISPREAVRMDPQQRLLLEVTWEALEHAGLAVNQLAGSATGVFIGIMGSDYTERQIKADATSSVNDPYFMIGSSLSAASGRLSYFFDFQGPNMAVDTACSSSLVSLHFACQSLRNQECDLAVVGGVNVITSPEGMINLCKMRMLSADGRCKTFDAQADGFALGDGCGIIIVKRLSDAQADGDNVLAIIRGTAVNEDGRSSSLTAPNGLAQQAVIRQALARAKVAPHLVSYVEAHGTGTALGDPIEMDSIQTVLKKNRSHPLTIGTVKTNIGHLSAAAGVAGVIKSVLGLQHQSIPPNLHLNEPNPNIAWDKGMIEVPTQLTPWEPIEGRRIAGVSSFGWSGTNAHVILEELPEKSESSLPRRPYHLFLLSAKTETALEAAINNLATYLEEQPRGNRSPQMMADVAYTLQVGRQPFEHRSIFVSQDRAEALAALNNRARLLKNRTDSAQASPTAFMFSGVGDHYVNMARDLYRIEPLFRQVVDQCCEFLHPILGLDLREVLYPAKSKTETEPNQKSSGFDLRQLLGRGRASPSAFESPPLVSPLERTEIAQPAVFVIGYALSQLLQSWGIVPNALIGYSLGEYVAACVAGVLSLPDALTLVARRAQMIQRLPTGSMLALPLSEAEVEPYLSQEICLAVALDKTCVLAGPTEAITALEKRLAAEPAQIVARRLKTSHAFHSTMMDPIVAEFTALVSSVPLNAPQIRYLSNVSGEWITEAEATDPTYWARHLCQTVRFGDGLSHLLQDEDYTLLELGPGQSLGSFVKQHPNCKPEQWARILPTLRYAYNHRSDVAFLLESVGKLWLSGTSIDWRGFYGATAERRQRLPLPTYPFERQRYWIDLPAAGRRDSLKDTARERSDAPAGRKKANLADWFYLPKWQESPILEPSAAMTAENQRESRESRSKIENRKSKIENRKWLIFEDELGWGAELGQRLRNAGAQVTRVQVGNRFSQVDNQLYTVRPDEPSDYHLLLQALNEVQALPTQIVHAWSLSMPTAAEVGIDAFNAAQRVGFYSLLYLTQAIPQQKRTQPLRITVLSNSMHAWREAEGPICTQRARCPEKATILALCRVIPQEYQHIRCRAVDVVLPDRAREALIDQRCSELVEELMSELATPITEPVVAYRLSSEGGESRRYVQTFEPKRLLDTPTSQQLRANGVYLITGGLGGIGLTLAEYLAQRVQAKLVLTSRSGLPERSKWATILKNEDHEHGREASTVVRRIQAIQKLEAMGAEVLVMAADVSNQKQMQAVIEQTYEQFGALHGVIHGAGLVGPNAFQSIQALDRAGCEAHFLPKAHGLYVLDKVLEGQTLDFRTSLSSLSSILGGLGFAAYAAANQFMDAYAHAHQEARWTTVNWDVWLGGQQQESESLGATTLAEFGMTPEEGKEAFALALASSETQLIHSTGELDARLRQWIMREDVETSPDAPAAPLISASRPTLNTDYVPATNTQEQRIAAIWQEVLGIEQIGIHDNFFDLGGNSLIGLQMIDKVQKAFQVQIPTVALFEAPSISTLAKYLQPSYPPAEEMAPKTEEVLLSNRRRARREGLGTKNEGIAVIGMAARFPGAPSVEAFWDNLCRGIESIARFSDEELLAAGIDLKLVNDPNYVKARPILDDIALFDAPFFGYSPREAELMDPQHRLFLECAYEALEGAGYAPEKYKGLIGVFGGSSLSSYMIRIAQDPQLMSSINPYQFLIAGDSDSLTTTVSYKLNLTGPSFAVQTFCSTSLVATHLACQSLLNGECDLAMAGGVSIHVPQKTGHLYAEGGMESPDGHCRSFDAQAKGTLFGDGVGMVVLKRLEEALSDGDTIHAVLKASAINNDGSLKVGYTAPSVTGQATAITTALQNGNIHPETIGYIEAHGSATPLGDPIEVAALTKAFRQQTEQRQYCAIGSVKTNVGHLNRAAGVAGLIKAVLTVKHGIIPANLHYQSPNPEIDFEQSPFYVNAHFSPWSGPTPRRAGVNSLGMGGTNAHVIIEEPPKIGPSGPSRPMQLLLLSARTESALEVVTANLAHYLRQNPTINLADVAYTLQIGRTSFDYRRLVLCQTVAEALQALESPEHLLTHYQRPINRPIVFMFPDVDEHDAPRLRGEQTGKQLYQSEPVFRDAVEQCCEILFPYLGAKIRDLLYSAQSPEAKKPTVTQPVAFAIEYALARLLISWGVQPQAYIGDGLGDYVAACLAGVLSLPDALKLVAERARLIQASPSGETLSASLSEELISSVTLHAPRLPYLSNVTGKAITAQQAIDPAYWVQQLCQPMYFFKGLNEVLKDKEQILLEVGPGQSLSTLAKQHPACATEQIPLILPTIQLPSGQDSAQGHANSEQGFLLQTLGNLWMLGCQPSWTHFYNSESRHRLELPTYPFERQPYWVEPTAPRLLGEASVTDALDVCVLSPQQQAKSSPHPRPALGIQYVAPRNELEEQMAAVWSQQLGIADIGINDNFFELGGHSLMGTQLMARLRQTWKVELPLAALLEAPTVAELALVVETALTTQQTVNSKQ